MATSSVPPSSSTLATSFHGCSAGPTRSEQTSFRLRPPDKYPEKPALKRFIHHKDHVDRWCNSKNTNSQSESPVVSKFKTIVSTEDTPSPFAVVCEDAEQDEMNFIPSNPRPVVTDQLPLDTNAGELCSIGSNLGKTDDNLTLDFVIPHSRSYQLISERPVIDEAASSSSQERVGIENFNALTLKETFTLMKDEEVPAVDLTISILQRCRDLKQQLLAKPLYLYICFSGLDGVDGVGNDLVATLIECKCAALAQQLFSRLNLRTEFSWTHVIREHTESGRVEQAISMFEQIKKDLVAASKFVYVALLKACAKLKALLRGQLIHLDVVKVGLDTDYFIGNMLVDLYAKCGSLAEAQDVFENLLVKDAISWTALMYGYVDKGLCKDAVDCFEQMLKKGIPPDEFVFTCVLKACSSMGTRERGQDIHAHLVLEDLEDDPVIGNALVDMYIKCGLLLEAQDVFDHLSVQDVISWTILIAGFAENGNSEAGIWLSNCMLEQALPPNHTTFASILKACMNLSDKEPGRRLHAQIIAVSRSGTLDIITATTLIEMYTKWGWMVDAQEVFDGMPERDVISWNALLTGYLQQGECTKVFQLFDRLKEECVQPDDISYLCVLTACSRMGLVDKGISYFDALREEDGVSANVKHYNCIVDLLGRTGELKEAMKVLQDMPFPPDLVAWTTLLAACQKWGNVEIGREAFEAALKLDEGNAVALHAMFNIYVEANMWDEARKIEALRAINTERKQHTKSSIEINGSTHTFVEGDASFSTFDYMYSKLQDLCDTFRDESAVQSLKFVMQGMGKSVEGTGFCGHSEVLAVLYGLISTPERTSLYVAKNNNVCRDCHVVMSLLSKVENRLICCQDVSHIHTFTSGMCSCEAR